MLSRIATFVFCCSILSACGDEKPLFAVVEATDVECRNGGYVFRAGTDRDGNDMLSDYEVTASHLVCDGADAEPSIGEITRTFRCDGVFSENVTWSHYVVLFSSGSAWTFATITSPDDAANGSSLDPPSVTEWSIAKTNVSDAWELRLDLDTHSTSVMHFDQDLPDGIDRQLFHDACVVTNH